MATEKNVISNFRGDYFFLSNFYPCKVEFEGMSFPCAEAAFQAAKTEDISCREKLSQMDTPTKAKRYGRKVPLREGYEEIKVSLMETVLRSKFSDKELQEKLLSTGDSILMEGNTWGDRFWGTVKGEGKNQLGQLLMKIRDELRSGNGLCTK